MIEITALNIYPVKSIQGIALKEATLGIRGLQYDRNWMLTDQDYRFVTQRQIAKMATIKVKLTDVHLVLEHPEHNDSLLIDLHRTNPNKVFATVWKDNCEAIDEGEQAADWFTEVLGRPLRLVRFSPDHRRQVDINYLKGEDSHTAFSDGFPFLITVEESLALLNQNLLEKGAEKVPMQRFRPNIVIKGMDAFAEDEVEYLAHGSETYVLGLRKPCQRCKITTVDQQSGLIVNPKEPLNTLVEMNPFPDKKGAFFGQNATLFKGDGTKISLGDQLVIRA